MPTDLTKLCKARNARLAKQNRPTLKGTARQRDLALVRALGEAPPELVSAMNRLLDRTRRTR
jgi:hypothetical protein